MGVIVYAYLDGFQLFFKFSGIGITSELNCLELPADSVFKSSYLGIGGCQGVEGSVQFIVRQLATSLSQLNGLGPIT